MEQVNVKINGISYEVPADSTILEAARYAGVDIPTLCYLKDVNQIGACRMCMVEVKGARSLVAACVYPVNEGMEVFTNTPKVQESRKMTLELLLSVHDKKCLSCERSGNCEFQKLCNDMGIEEENRFEGAVPAGNKDFSTLYLERNNAKCVLCRRCVAACQNQHVSVIGANNRGFDTEIGCAFENPLSNVACVACGQCIVSCPTGALTEKDNTQEVIDAINDPSKVVIVQTAPRRAGCLGRGIRPAHWHQRGGQDGCRPCAAWALTRCSTPTLRRYDHYGGGQRVYPPCEERRHSAHDYLLLSRLGQVLRALLSRPAGQPVHLQVPPEHGGRSHQDLVCPEGGHRSPRHRLCLRHALHGEKFEITRDDENAAGLPDVDISITTRELARMIKKAQLNFNRLPKRNLTTPWEFPPALP